MYSSYGIAFDELISWNFGNDFAINVIVFGVDNSSSSRISSHDKSKNNFLVLGKLPTDDINESIGGAEKKFSINFSKAKTEFCLSLHYNYDKCYLFVTTKEIYKFKSDNKNVNFQTQFFLGRISNKFVCVPSKTKDVNVKVFNMIRRIN